ncbi:MAG: hypothetical protein IT385_00395 [Deltaproteobacteria bacterium]|nr:hypothetical protein [Deltaproteobacteria bacterium]
MNDIVLDASGEAGQDGARGRGGSDGVMSGGDGGDGGDAGPAAPGVPGGRVALTLGHAGGEVVIVGVAEPARRAPARVETRVRADALGEARLVATGGKGGDGGQGGDGGDGARGSDGRDATATSSGSNGGNGGDGGDGGRGTDGASGGAGGVIEVRTRGHDTWLLMVIAGADQPASLVAGGEGGAAGRHGRGGRGGSGGSGGSSFNGSDSSGDHVYRSGGFSGSSGSRGSTPTTPLFDGPDGASGRFTIEVTDAPHRGVYDRRYDLRARAFALDETTEGDDRDGIFELGEVVVAEDLDLQNDGGMPSPEGAPATIEVLPGRLVEPLGDQVTLGRSLAVHEHALLPGPIRFRIPRPEITEQGDPLILEEDVVLRVTQRGPPGVPFVRAYGDRHARRRLVARFPVENRDHVHALRSLSPGESTRWSFTVHNVSRALLGEARRPVAIQVQLAGGELTPGDVEIRGPDGIIDLAGAVEGRSGAFHRIAALPAGGSYTLAGELRVRDGLPPYAHARLRFTIWLAELGAERREVFFAVQHRDLEVRIEPRFRARPDGKALLCLNDRTTRPAYLAWSALFAEELGLAHDTWSLSREGHFDWRRELEDGTTLKAWLADRVAVVINQPFHPRASAETDWPAEYVPAREMREGATYEGTHLLLVGGSDVALTELLRPTAEARLTGDDFEDEAHLLGKEAKTGGAMTQEVVRDDLTLAWDEVGLHRTALFGRPRLLHVHSAARRLLERLEALYPSRRYVIVYHPDLDRPPIGRRWLLWRRWRVGRAEVRRTLDIDTSSAVLLAATDKELSDPAYITGPEVRYTVLLSLPFTDKIERLFSFLARGRLETAGLCALAILVDIAEEQTALRRGEVELGDEVLRERLAVLDELGRGDWPAVDGEGKRVLTELVGGIRALAGLERAWWMWWGRNKRISRHMLARADVLQAAWGCDPERVAEADQRHRARVRQHFPAMSVRRAARRYFEQPPELHAHVTRDIDVWLAPDARVWSADDLAAARQAEVGRVAKQARLYADNVAARRAMTAPSEDEAGAVKTVGSEVATARE